MRLAVVAVTLALVGPSYVWAESLGEVAAREREKKKGKPAGKVITEQDLGKRHGKGNYNNPDETQAPPPDTTEPATGETPVVAAAAAEGAAPKDKPKTSDEVRAEAHAAWRKRVDEKNKQIAELQAHITTYEGARLYADQAELAALEDERRRNGWR
jgi:hypothetical protein